MITRLLKAAVFLTFAAGSARAAAAAAPPPPSRTVPGLPFFVYNHNALMRTRLDPLVQPGIVSAHTHIFGGSNRVTADANFASITAADSTTAPITIDKSLYWAPILYYKDEQSKYHVMSGDGLVTYWFYHIGKDDPDSFPELPDDFRMVAGDMKRNSLDLSRAPDQAVTFQCFGPGYSMRLPYIPADFECETIRPQVSFPNCWDTKNAYKSDNSHVAYGEGDYMYGKCPPGFKRIPTLFLETVYKPALMLGAKYKWRAGSLVFSYGDNFGLTFHADWMNGFPKGALNKAYDECKNTLDGQVTSCPYFQKSIQAEPARDCSVQGNIVNEAVGIQAPLDHLPGNNVEYNSSALANFPKKPDPAYSEKSKVVKIEPANKGTCKSQICQDYSGPKDGPGLTFSVATPAQASGTSSAGGGGYGGGGSGGGGGDSGGGGSGGGGGGGGGKPVVVIVYETVYVTGLPPGGGQAGATTSVKIPAAPGLGATSSTALNPAATSSTANSGPGLQCQDSRKRNIPCPPPAGVGGATSQTRVVNGIATSSVSVNVPALPGATSSTPLAGLAASSSTPLGAPSSLPAANPGIVSSSSLPPAASSSSLSGQICQDSRKRNIPCAQVPPGATSLTSSGVASSSASSTQSVARAAALPPRHKKRRSGRRH